MAKYLTENKDLGELVRKMETNFISGGGTQMSKYVNNDLYEDISKIYAYLNSKHISGEKDSQRRDKPFFNIVLAARNIYYRATDIDRKDITVIATKLKDTIAALFATAYLQDWMRREDFGTFLNKWGMVLAEFNSAVVKFVDTGKELHAVVVPWSRIICDQINFDANMKIELIELTEAELYERVKTHGYDKDMVEKICDTAQSRELTDHTKQDQKSDYFKLYEVHGNLPLSMLTGNEKDEDTYAQQMHVITFLASKQKGEYDDFTLVSGREEQDPYMLTWLLPSSDGSISLNGSVKNLFEAQWMMNHGAKAIKDQLDLANKLVFQTADSAFVGRNVLTAVQNGDILIHKENMPLTQFNNNSHDIQTTKGFMDMWKGLSSEINGVSESMLGQVAPSGTAWRQVEALLNESHSLFDLMTENKGLQIEQMLRRYVIPHAKKKMNNKEEILATLNSYNITKFDSMYVPNEAVRRYNNDFAETVLNGENPSTYQPDIYQQQVKQELSSMGNQRPLSPGDINWSELFKDLEWNLEINVTGEAKDKNQVLTTLTTALNIVASPGYANNPQAQFIVGKALMATGEVSPLELASLPAPQPVSVGGPGNGGQLPVANQ